MLQLQCLGRTVKTRRAKSLTTSNLPSLKQDHIFRHECLHILLFQENPSSWDLSGHQLHPLLCYDRHAGLHELYWYDPFGQGCNCRWSDDNRCSGCLISSWCIFSVASWWEIGPLPHPMLSFLCFRCYAWEQFIGIRSYLRGSKRGAQNGKTETAMDDRAVEILVIDKHLFPEIPQWSIHVDERNFCWRGPEQ